MGNLNPHTRDERLPASSDSRAKASEVVEIVLNIFRGEGSSVKPAPHDEVNSKKYQRELPLAETNAEEQGETAELPSLVSPFQLLHVRSRKVRNPPGTLLLSAAEFFFSRRSFEDILHPTIEDLRTEYNEALNEKRIWKARWVRMRGSWSFFCAAGLISFVSFGKYLVRLWKVVP